MQKENIKMTSIEEAAKEPSYDAAATAASKATIFVFIGTFLYYTA